MQVAIFGSLREVAGVSMIDVPSEKGGSVRDVLDGAFRHCPELRESVLDEEGQLRDFVSVLLGGRNIQLLQGLETPIGEAGRVAIFPAVAGGV